MPATSEIRRRLVCRCMGVASPRIFQAIREQNLKSVREVTEATRAGGGCGTCHEEIEEILADVQGLEVDPMTRMENQLLCQSETENRIEATMENLVIPELETRNLTIEGFSIQGLMLSITVQPPIGKSSIQFIQENLREHICPDLEIRILAGQEEIA